MIVPPSTEAQASTGPESLQTSLHAATRSLHTQLNKSIMARLPLCLPPHARDPTAYHVGILAFGQIFVAFERGTQAARLELSDNAARYEDRTRQLNILKTIETTGLSRTEKLHQDRDTLGERLRQQGTIPKDRLSHIQTEVDRTVQAQTAYISSNIQSKPHLSLAYQWTMYLALFNGGRHLHRALLSAGPAFWMDTHANDGRDALSFWTFDAATESDPMADALKHQFKANFDAASKLLTDTEREEVVEESKSIFRLCVDLVAYLDETMSNLSPEELSANYETHQGYAQYVPGQAWKMWGAIQSAGLSVVNGILPDTWRRPPLVQEVKE